MFVGYMPVVYFIFIYVVSSRLKIDADTGS